MKLLILLILFTNILFANVGKIVSLKGEANITRDNKTFQVKRDTLLKEKDLLTTKNNSKVQILFKDETIISIGKNSTFKINDYLFENKDNVKAEFSMIKGVFRTITGKIGKIAPQNFKLKTKSASIGIRGTQIITQITEGTEKIFCTEGQIEVTQNSTNLKIIVNKGEFVAMETADGNSLQKNKTKTKDLKEVNKDVSVNENKAQDTVTKEENIIETPTSTLETQTITSEVEVATEIVKVAAESESNDEVSEKLDEEAKSVTDEDNESVTSEAYYENNTNKATYIGNFNSVPFDSGRQYIQDLEKRGKLAIPTNTSISMDIDFGKADNQVTNGKILVSGYIPLEFNGYFDDDKTLKLNPANNSSGAGGTASLYGEEGNIIKGDILLLNDNIKIQGNFEADKYEYTDLDKLTQDTYFVDNFSKATYVGEVNTNGLYDLANISMDIDFGAGTNQITNGSIDVQTESGFSFVGSIDQSNNANFVGTEGTTGVGTGKFYGDEANQIKGVVSFINETDGIVGDFEVSKSSNISESQ